MTRQPPECVEAYVAVVHVPQPGVLVVARRETDGTGNVEAQDVQPITPATNFGEETTLAVPDPQDAVLDQHLGATLF